MNEVRPAPDEEVAMSTTYYFDAATDNEPEVQPWKVMSPATQAIATWQSLPWYKRLFYWAVS